MDKEFEILPKRGSHLPGRPCSSLPEHQEDYGVATGESCLSANTPGEKMEV